MAGPYIGRPGPAAGQPGPVPSRRAVSKIRRRRLRRGVDGRGRGQAPGSTGPRPD